MRVNRDWSSALYSLVVLFGADHLCETATARAPGLGLGRWMGTIAWTTRAAVSMSPDWPPPSPGTPGGPPGPGRPGEGTPGGPPGPGRPGEGTPGGPPGGTGWLGSWLRLPPRTARM